MKQKGFLRSVVRIAIPVALQSMLQSSFAMIDQIMVGRLGSTSIAAIGIAGKSLCVNLAVSLALGAVFTLLCLLLPERLMGLYSKDAATVRQAGAYLRIISGTFLPLGAASILSVMLRCHDKANAPLIASLLSAVTNTVLNYLLIFGRLGFPALGFLSAWLLRLPVTWTYLIIGLEETARWAVSAWLFRGGKRMVKL